MDGMLLVLEEAVVPAVASEVVLDMARRDSRSSLGASARL